MHVRMSARLQLWQMNRSLGARQASRAGTPLVCSVNVFSHKCGADQHSELAYVCWQRRWWEGWWVVQCGDGQRVPARALLRALPRLEIVRVSSVPVLSFRGTTSKAVGRAQLKKQRAQRKSLALPAGFATRPSLHGRLSGGA